MAFWKKSDDPWDRKPQNKQRSATWWENDAPPEEKEVPLVEKAVENVENSPETREKCPWCGEMMLSGHVYGGRDGAWWKEGEPLGFLGSLLAEQSPRQMRIGGGVSWYCEKCEKLVISASGLEIPVAEQRTSFHEYVDQWNESEERRKKGD